MNKTIVSLLACSFLAGCGPSTKEIQNVGSDTMLEVAGAWAEAYMGAHKDQDGHPLVAISVSGGGSGVGIKNLIDGDVDVANASRAMKPEEIQQAEKNGVEPIQHKVGYDGIAIFVHRDNPIQSITIEQLKEMFGDGGKLSKWSEIGVDLGKDADPIVFVSRQNNSGTYEYFKESVLGGEKARYKRECNNLNSSKDVVDFCAKTKGAIGYSGLAYASDKVRMVPVVKGDKAIAPSIDTVIDGTYPISRPLFMYTKGEPQGDVKHYLDWIKSDDGQRVLMKKGYPPLRKLD
ncbi:MAG: PstS family phosphate ABC transporter substrate-binding protein [Planctomycetota bacterium]